MSYVVDLFLRADELREAEHDERGWGYISDGLRNIIIFKRNRDKVIKGLEIEDNVLKFMFEDGTMMSIADEGQNCCEHRYVYTSDNLADYLGATLVDIDVKESSYLEEDDGDIHECIFIHITTSKGQFVTETHNEHNGYYGGFSITLEDSISAQL